MKELVGGCGARAVSRKTPIYFICIIPKPQQKWTLNCELLQNLYNSSSFIGASAFQKNLLTSNIIAAVTNKKVKENFGIVMLLSALLPTVENLSFPLV